MSDGNSVLNQAQIYQIQTRRASVTCNEKPVTINVVTSIILYVDLCENL